VLHIKTIVLLVYVDACSYAFENKKRELQCCQIHTFSREFTLFHIFSREFTLFHTFSREFTLFHTFSREFTLFHTFSHFVTWIHVNSREFTWIHVNSREFTNFHTFSRNLFFYRYGRQTKLNIASHELFHKKSFIFPIRGGNMDCFEYERFFVKKCEFGSTVCILLVRIGEKREKKTFQPDFILRISITLTTNRRFNSKKTLKIAVQIILNSNRYN
jgi:hypothetical protein